MAYENITSRNLSRGFQEILYYANDVTNSWLSNLILIAIYMIVLISVYNYRKDFVEAMALAGFLTFVVGLFFFIGDFISGVTLVFVVAMTIISIILLVFTKRR